MSAIAEGTTVSGKLPKCVIEDHALRHSWHHLSKIRKAVGR